MIIDGLYELTIKEAKMFNERSYDKAILSIDAHDIVRNHIESLNIKVGDLVAFKDNDKNIKFRHNMTYDLYRYDGMSIVEGFKKFNSIQEYCEYLNDNNEEVNSTLFNSVYPPLSKFKTAIEKNKYEDDKKLAELLFPIYRIFVRPVGKHELKRLRSKFVDKNEDGKFITLLSPEYDVISTVDEYYSHLDTCTVFDSLILSTLTKDVDNE